MEDPSITVPYELKVAVYIAQKIASFGQLNIISNFHRLSMPRMRIINGVQSSPVYYEWHDYNEFNSKRFQKLMR